MYVLSTFTLPVLSRLTETDYLDGFDLKAMQSDLDMINFMSYDLHGSWDQPLLAESHTNLTGTYYVCSARPACANKCYRDR